MEEQKNFLASRRVQGSAAAIVLVLVNALGLDAGQGEIVETGINGALGVFALIRFALHFFRPDSRKLVLGKPKG
jgi:hypothetical protein